jgi:hypothetical protein
MPLERNSCGIRIPLTDIAQIAPPAEAAVYYIKNHITFSLIVSGTLDGIVVNISKADYFSRLNNCCVNEE